MASTVVGGVHPIPPEVQVEQNLLYWENRYKCRSIQWHIDEVHPQLLRYLSLLTQQGAESKPESKKKLKFFLPLCGKTKDIPFLVNLGFEVFGIEMVSSVIEEWILENNLELSYDETRLLYHNKDESLKIYCGDLFKCPIEKYGPFDCVWDRASFIALDYAFRPSYLDMMKRAVLAHGNSTQHDFRYLLQSVKYDKTNFNFGPPRCVDKVDIEEFFASWANVTCLESNWVNFDHPCRKVSNFFDHAFFEEFHMIQPKVSPQ